MTQRSAQREVSHTPGGDGVYSLTIAPDGVLLSGGDDGMRVWIPQQGWKGYVVEPSGRGVRALTVGKGGRVYSSSDDKVLLWT